MKNYAQNNQSLWLIYAAIAVITGLFLLISPEAFAAGTGEGLPWEGPLDKLKRSLSGPVAMAISLVALVACGATLIFGGDMNEFSRKMVMVVMGVAVLVSSSSVLEMLFENTGAVLY